MQKRVIISILNWNSAALTMRCIRSLLALDAYPDVQTEIVVTDNGSRAEDHAELRTLLAGLPVPLKRNESNLGFAGGHNGMMQAAINGHADFVWLVNSDAEVTPASLGRMLAVMDDDSRCGAVSPLIVVPGSDKIDFCGARHDWQKLGSVFSKSIEQTRAMEAAYPSDMWLMGAAVMFRVSAIRQTGV
ncbi:MAG: glycosyltransferase, partial [Tardiphaga sp.]|nr:glycosyltransferase [Tardiphaga sp.]